MKSAFGDTWRKALAHGTMALACLLFLLLSAIGHSQQSPQRPTASALLGEASRAARDGNATLARQSLILGYDLFRGDERFAVELAGLAFMQRDYREARQWLRSAPVSLDQDPYVKEFLGTLLLLDGQTEATLIVWKPLGKPLLSPASATSGLETIVRPQLASSATRFPAGDVMEQRHFLLAQRRIAQLGVCGTTEIRLDAVENEQFEPRVRCVERPGITRSPIALAVMLSRGLAYQTSHLHEPNLRGTAVSLKAMFRWDPRKRRLWTEASTPLLGEAAWRLRWFADARQEHWQMLSPVDRLVQQAFQLQRLETGVSVGAVLGPRITWQNEVALSHRAFTQVQQQPLGTSRLDAGMSLRYGHSVHADIIRLPLRRIFVDATAAASYERYPTLSRNLWRGTGEMRAMWLPAETGEDGRITLRLRGGGLHGNAPLTELFAMGLERDGAIPLRAHIGTSNGHKGSALFGDQYYGASIDVRKLLLEAGALRLAISPFVDLGWMRDPLRRYGSGSPQCDAGVQLVASSPGGTEFRLAWGWDLRNRRRSFYAWSDPFP